MDLDHEGLHGLVSVVVNPPRGGLARGSREPRQEPHISELVQLSSGVMLHMSWGGTA